MKADFTYPFLNRFVCLRCLIAMGHPQINTLASVLALFPLLGFLCPRAHAPIDNAQCIHNAEPSD